MKIGYFLSSEEYGPAELLEQATLAEGAGFDALWISDHFHPWNDEQGHSPFVWSVLGALGTVTSLPVTTSVTCPTMRIHPVIIAQAAATVSTMLPGGFRLGVGTGEALNEHVTGVAFPNVDERLAMLEEAISLIRELWQGDFVTRRGRYYTAEHARIYTLPERPPQILVSGFGPKAIDVAARVGDGFISTMPSVADVCRFREHGGGAKTAQAGYKVCWGRDDDAAVAAAHRLWANSGLPGEAAQVLPSPRHFEQLSALVSEDMTRDSVAYGADVTRHVAAFSPYADAGFDEVYISQMGGSDPATDYHGFFEFYRDAVLPELRKSASSASR